MSQAKDSGVSAWCIAAPLPRFCAGRFIVAGIHPGALQVILVDWEREKRFLKILVAI